MKILQSIKSFIEARRKRNIENLEKRIMGLEKASFIILQKLLHSEIGNLLHNRYEKKLLMMPYHKDLDEGKEPTYH